MALLISFLIGIQLFHAVASVPLPHFLSPSCNSLGVNIAAEEALNKHNKYRTEGYVLGLQRIFDAQEVSENDESVYNLILDVLETDCHVRSRKSWKECKFRRPHETVFGHCEIIIRLNRKTNDSFLHRNNCILRPLSTPPCPGCPVRKNPSEDSLQEAAKESLAKFNAENGHNHYFALVEVTKASSQVVAGISKIVEFIIQETSCHKSTPVSDLSQCSLLSSQTAEAGLCKGSVLDRGIKLQKTVSVNCEFFPHPELHHPQHSANATETPANQKETGGQVIDYLPVSKPDVAELKEPHPTVPGLGEETTSTIPPYPKGFSESAECPGKVAIEIRGLQLPSRPQAETSQTKGDVQH
ncbi:fetuin-B-like [Crotalus tigris]|uniref:fetuin-B-like n=1 Tax=Crotalus tigris TaxID=88082 RepID=UPI00192F95DF|nr:fetuin-B-like [Crotalus tigris]